ncbi:M56 family metallopeptidase [Streptomyces violaceusniger]|uniref:Peptidase M48 Ste24p n=1 Tax=Streptomyces violaceusniger (strain Tu 4113) TaxID=653045 RepID=G2P2P7_STRV4|nr:M56 family metallopeptidase [Streptomyces violaceusniger]AEM82170.1 peptidase M48 Ste24p [Streptomyces violaceusniger Tu 4113]
MRFSVYIPFVVSALLAVLAPWAARHLPPRPAAWALTCAVLVMAGGWVGALALLAFTRVGQIPEVAEQGPWSVTALRAENPVRSAVAVVCGLALTGSALCFGIAARRHLRDLLMARRHCRRLPAGELAVIDDPVPEAYALPGTPGRIVVSSGMLRALDGAERQALLAHERAHLRYRHHAFQIAWRLAAAVNPLLRPLATAGAFVLERWADEEAAAATGDRAVVARAVARAALAANGDRRHRGVLAADGGPVPRRVKALLAPALRPRRLPLIAGGLLLALCCGSLVEAAVETDEMFASAMYPHCPSAHHGPHEPFTDRTVARTAARSGDRLDVSLAARHDCRAGHRAEEREIRHQVQAGQ